MDTQPEASLPEDQISNAGPNRLSLKDLLRLSLRVFITKPSRTVLTVMGMSLGVGVVLTLISLGYGLQYLLVGRIVTTQDSLITLEAYYSPESDLKIKKEQLENIQRSELVKEISPVAEFPGEVRLAGEGSGTSTQSGFLMVRVVTPNHDRLSGLLANIKNEQIKNITYGAVVSEAALRLLNYPADATTLGKKLDIGVFYPAGTEESPDEVKNVKIKQSVEITGILTEEGSQPFVMIPDNLLPEGDAPPYFQKVFVRAKTAEEVEAIRTKLIADGFLVSSKIDMVNQVQRIMSIVTIVLGVFGVAALLVSAIGMFNTMLVSFLERVGEVGIMKAIGATNRDIRNLFIMESFMMGFMGGVGGIVLGTVISESINLGLNILANSFGGKSLDLFKQPWWFMGMIVAMSSLIGVFSGFWPARKAMKVSPQRAFRGSG